MTPNIDALLQLFADYHSFCKQPQFNMEYPATDNCELSEEELAFVAAAAHVPQPNNKKENP